MSDRRQRRYDEIHERIIRAGIRLHGGPAPAEITVADIAESADVAVATFYNHFESFEAFRDEIGEIQQGHISNFAAQYFTDDRDLGTAVTTWLSGLWRGTEDFPDDLRHALHLHAGEAGEWTALEDEIHQKLVSSDRHRPQQDDELATVTLRAAVRAAVRHRLDETETVTEWKDVAYPLLRMLGVDPADATDAVSAARSAELERV